VPAIVPPQDGFLFLDKAKFTAAFAAVHDTPIVSKLMPWVLGNLWPNAARGEHLMLGEVIPPGDER
jgi:hypothetical protein